MFLPRFKLAENYDLEDVLCSLGMLMPFRRTGQTFLECHLGRELFLSKFMHKSFAELNKESMEAVASTAAIMML